jgi:hypothetical protein
MPEARLRRRLADLPQHEDHLAAVMRRVRQDVLDELSQNVRVVIDRARRAELLLGQVAEEHGLPFFVALPAGDDRRQIRKIRRREVWRERSLLPVPEPADLSPEDVPQGPTNRSEAPAEISFELRVRQLAGRLEQDLVGPAVVGKNPSERPGGSRGGSVQGFDDNGSSTRILCSASSRRPATCGTNPARIAPTIDGGVEDLGFRLERDVDSGPVPVEAPRKQS